MTTQELKQQIDKVLGNNIRCLLPSYWWKRLFNQVTDRIDEVEQSTSKLIESKVEEVKMPIVESVDELEKLELAKGRVAAVEKVGEPVIVNYEDCYKSTDYVNDWDKYTIVRGVSKIGEVPLDAEGGGIYLIADKYDLESDMISIAIEDGRRLYGKFSGGRFSYITLNKVNEYLASGRYRLTGGYLSNRIAQYFTFYSAFPQPSLYIKGDSWEKLSKEYVVSSEEELNALSVENGTIAKVAREEEKFVGVGTLLQYEDGIDYNSLFTVKKVSISVPKTSIGELSLVYLSTREGNITLTIVCSAGGKDGYIQAWYEDGRKVDLMREQTLVQSNIDDLNSYLSKNVVRYISAGASSGSQFEFIDTWFKVAAPYTVANAYIKGETWTRLLKDGDVTGGESSGKVDRVIYGFNTDLTAEHVESNKETYRLFSEGKASITILAGGVFFFTPNRYYHYNDSFVFVFVYDAYQCGIILNEDGTVEYESDLIVDSELSDTSENPVQNKAIKAYVDEKVANSGGGSSVDVDTELSNTSTNPVQNKVITNAINAKADNTRVDLISERLDDLESEMVTDADLDRAIANAIINTLNTEV